MKSFDELRAMTDPERMAYLEQEVERVISSAPPNQVLKLRALQARMDGIRAKVHNPVVRMHKINDEMMRSFLELNEALKPWRTEQ